MSRSTSHAGRRASGPSQRQLRAGELVRHALTDILRAESFADPHLADASITISEVRASPDLKHAVVFIEPLGGRDAGGVVEALNRASRFLRGRLGHAIEMRFTPQLKFVHDDSFDNAAHIGELMSDPRVQRDLHAEDEG
ncbi:MAG: 30S ribosome-binding factor RbfA [Caulobacteraceae bacterium]|nr:30S ribosome-binding factor RbfA [Caulobacteraceae bacterium]